MPRLLSRLAALLTALLIVIAAGTPALAGAKPPDPYPAELKGLRVGIHKTTGEYCDLEANEETCRPQKDCEDFPTDQRTVCLGEGSRDEASQRAYDLGQLKRWQEADKKTPNHAKRNAFMTKCVEKEKKTYQVCMAALDKEEPLPPPIDVKAWVAGKISEMAAKALEEAATILGNGVMWLLEKFADAFNEVSTIDLSKSGIGSMLGIMTGLSVLVAAFLLLVQFGKAGVSQNGGPIATAFIGLAKWAAITSVYLLATQVTLNWSDTLSTEIIKFAFDGGDKQPASEVLKTRMGSLFGGLTGGAVVGGAIITGTGMASATIGVVIVISILCILAIAALWIEMIMRQAGLLILMVTMPIVLAGQMADSTRDWWPKARNAVIALILMKPMIVVIFAIGIKIMEEAQGIRNVIVGFVIFTTATASWPVLARFMVFSSVGDGASSVGSQLGSVVGGMFGGNQSAPSGAGTVGGGSGYTKALDADTTATATDSGSDGGGGSGGGGGSFWGKAMKGSGSGSALAKGVGVAAMGLQVAAAAKDVLETGFANTAAHAGLGPAAQGGRPVITPRRSDDPTDAQSADQPAASTTAESDPPAPPPPIPSQAAPAPTASSTASTTAESDPPEPPGPAPTQTQVAPATSTTSASPEGD
ncbi:hypothetical protein [Streptomyces sp. NPDC058623]|uniref:hypothetical protein n=1 Tax=Streptomyces sp. NPDC058623 TaxID=3346563 RepID=UPI00364646B2